MLETNIIFFQQDLPKLPLNIELDKSITRNYKTVCYMSRYDIEARISLAELFNKKFGFVLKTLKSC